MAMGSMMRLGSCLVVCGALAAMGCSSSSGSPAGSSDDGGGGGGGGGGDGGGGGGGGTPAPGTFGATCGADTDCTKGTNACVFNSSTGGSGFCSKPCETPSDCPSQYDCQQINGAARKYCVPEDHIADCKAGCNSYDFINKSDDLPGLNYNYECSFNRWHITIRCCN